MSAWVLAAVLALAAPADPLPSVLATPEAQIAPAARAPPAAATTAAAPPTAEEVMALPAVLRQRVAEQVTASARSDTQRLQRLMEVMFGRNGLGIEYRDEATTTVEQAYLTRKANCLTFTLLFVALAREAGLEAYAQEIDQTLAWHQDQSTIYRTNHVNAGVRIGARRYTVDVGSDALIGRNPPERVSDQRLLAHFYSNRAASLMAQHDLQQAARHMRVAMQLDPGYANSWSNQGVLYLRQGELEQAHQAYLRALELDPSNSSALFNMLALVQRTGDAGGEAEYRRRLERVQARDPFHQFLLAIDHERHGRDALAATHYRRAIQLHGREHRFHFALARVYLRLGQPKLGERALRRAQALGGEAWRSVYQQKLDGLARN